MILLLSGEGPTDLGVCTNALGCCANSDFTLGPMTVMVVQMLEHWLKYDLRNHSGCIHYVSETWLAQKAKSLPSRFRGKTHPPETGLFFRNAQALGVYALEIEQKNNDTKTIAILFRDCDGAQSASPALWQEKWGSMMNGFKGAGFPRGVPMLPKPKSEAWLCCVMDSKQNNCQTLEELSGNDASLNSAKKKLAAIFGSPTANTLCKWIEDHPFDLVSLERMQTMPSFKAFFDRLEAVVKP